jgi:hypothetical protein
MSAFTEQAAAKPPEAYYDVRTKEYLVKDQRGRWIGLAEVPFKRVLRQHGVPGVVDKDTGLSAQDNAILELQMQRNVFWAGSLAGYKAGFYETGSTRILVTSSPRILEPAAGDWTMLRGVIEGVLGDLGGVQLPYVYGWLKVAYESLRAGMKLPGQVFVMCGPHGCGKSLLQQLITVILGGRVAKPYQVMTGGTAFNSDLFGSEHLAVEDEQPSTDIRARRAFGAQIKNVTVNVDQRLHQKHRDAIVLQPFWRMSVSINDESENVQILPVIDDSIEDKLMIFRAERHVMPMPTGTAAERAAFWARLVSELPAMLKFLVNMEIPDGLRCERFGVQHYHHPEIMRLLNEVAPEVRLLTLIDATYFASPAAMLGVAQSTPRGPLVMTAEEIESGMTGAYASHSFEARRLLGWSNACGTYLGRLAKVRPDRVQAVRTADARRWQISPPPGEEGESAA